MIRIVIAVIGIFVTTAAGLCSQSNSVLPPITGCAKPMQTVPELGEFPYVVSLQLVTVGCTDPSYHICGGAILDHRWILTSAYCVSEPGFAANLLVKAGKINLSRPKEALEQVINVVSVYVHDFYRGQPGVHDIALLRLQEPLTYSTLVLPVSLPPVESTYSGTAYFTGWDTTSSFGVELRKFKSSVFDDQACESILDEYFDAAIHARSNVCGITKCGARSLCAGHYGGPLVHYVLHGPEVIGVATTTGAPCGLPGTISVYTKVAAYVRWIKITMETKH